MKPEEIRQLLGGYASGTLSEAEQKLLFDAAMEDQVLFDALADEEALKVLLADPESPGFLQAVFDERPDGPGIHAPGQSWATEAPAPQILRKPTRRPASSRATPDRRASPSTPAHRPGHQR